MSDPIISFSQELLLSLCDNSKEYPVLLDRAWICLGFKCKDKAKVNFLSCGFVENVDYVIEQALDPMLEIMSPDLPKDVLIEAALDTEKRARRFSKKEEHLPERVYSDALSSFLGGRREVTCALGRVDVLAKEVVVEVKIIKQWKKAIQQVNAYAGCFPEKSKIIFLIDNVPFTDYSSLHNAAKKHNVTIWLLSEMYKQISPFLNAEPHTNSNLVLERIALTWDCFRTWAILTKTTQAKEIIQYFLAREKQTSETQTELNNKGVKMFDPSAKHVFNNTEITQRSTDGYIDATAMCKANGKRYNDYSSLKTTDAFIEALSADTKIPVSALTETTKGGNDKQAQGTFVHPQIAINLGQWCSAPFAVWVSKLVMAWMTGQLDKTDKTQTELLYDTTQRLTDAVGRLVEQERLIRELEQQAKRQADKLESHSERLENVEAQVNRNYNAPQQYYNGQPISYPF